MIAILGAGIAGLSAAETLRGRSSIPIKALERGLVAGGATRPERFGEFRSALFRYASSDHCMDMGIWAAHNILGGSYDVEAVRTEPGYAEDGEFAAPRA